MKIFAIANNGPMIKIIKDATYVARIEVQGKLVKIVISGFVRSIMKNDKQIQVFHFFKL